MKTSLDLWHKRLWSFDDDVVLLRSRWCESIYIDGGPKKTVFEFLMMMLLKLPRHVRKGPSYMWLAEVHATNLHCAAHGTWKKSQSSLLQAWHGIPFHCNLQGLSIYLSIYLCISHSSAELQKHALLLVGLASFHHSAEQECGCNSWKGKTSGALNLWAVEF